MPNTPALVGEGMFGDLPGHVLQRRAPAAGARAAGRPAASSSSSTRVAGRRHRRLRLRPRLRLLPRRGDDRRRRRSRTRPRDGAQARHADARRRGQAAGRRPTTTPPSCVAASRRPNGTTAAAIEAFDERGVHDALVAGVLAAARRSAELSGTPRLTSMSDRPTLVFDERLIDYDFGPSHPLAPIRVALTIQLARELGVHRPARRRHRRTVHGRRAGQRPHCGVHRAGLAH